MIITQPECVSLALDIQHVMRMRRIILSSVTCLAVQYFSRLPYKRQDFREEVFEHKMRVLIFSVIFSETFLILRRIWQYIIKVQRSLCKVPVILLRF